MPAAPVLEKTAAQIVLEKSASKKPARLCILSLRDNSAHWPRFMGIMFASLILSPGVLTREIRDLLASPIPDWVHC